MNKHIIVPIAVLCALIAGFWLGLLQPLDEWIRDQRFRFGDRAPSGEIVLVDIDARSIDGLGGWSWKRSVYGELVDRLTEMGASVIAFDVDFSSPSYTEEDAAFASAMARSDAAIYLAAFNQPLESGSESLHGNRPIALFADVARPAVVNVFADRDAIVRTFPYGAMVGDVPVQSIAAVLANYSGQLEGLFLVDFTIQIDMFENIPVIDVLTGAIAAERIAGKKVVIGANAAELRDFFTVPRFGIISGHTLQAAAAETLLQKRAIDRSPGGIVVLLMLGTAVFAAWSQSRFSLARSQILLAGGLVSLEGAAAMLQVWEVYALQTAGADLVIVCFALLAVAREIDIKSILLLVSESRAENTKAILDRVINDNSDGIVVLSEDGKIRTINRSAETFFRNVVHQGEALPKDLIGMPLSGVAPERLAEEAQAEFFALEEGRQASTALRLLDKAYGDHGRCVLEYSITLSRLDGGVDFRGREQPDKLFACVSFRDVTERQERDERASFLARFDQATGLPNRNSFLEFLNGIPEGKAAITDFTAIVRLSVRRLQNIQDTMGQDFAFDILNLVANRIDENLTHEEYLAATGDSGFHIFLIENTRTMLQDRLDFLLERISKPYFHDGHGATVGASAGVALVDDPSVSPETYLQRAKTALSEALSEDGNAWSVYEEDLDIRIQTRQRLELDLWKAFEERQFVNFYQPQINLVDGTLYGAEALIRWIHPERGFVSPGEFIPIAEQSSLIVEMGEWAMTQACMDAASWPGALKVAVNLSPMQFFQGDLVGTVENALKLSGLDKARLDLEITESLFIEDTGRILELMSKLRAMGLRFALDDFGTGYSSLGYIKSFPMDKIKIDQSFVRGMQDGSTSISIVRAVSDMAKGLNMETVAEGVETEVERKLVTQVGCRVGQGYLFSKPLPPDEMKRFAENFQSWPLDD